MRRWSRHPLPQPLLVVLEPEPDPLPRLERLAEAGCRWFWLRAKALSLDAVDALLDRLLPAVEAAGATLSLGCHVETAIALGHPAIHLPGDEDPGFGRPWLGPRALIGQSAHSLADCRRAARAGLDYVTLSPIWPPSSKAEDSRAALGTAALTRPSALLPVLALGGLTPERAAAALAEGAAGAAVAGALVEPDPLPAAQSFLAALSRSEPIGREGVRERR